MKKLFLAAVCAASMCVVAEDAPPASAPVPAAAAAKKARPNRPQLTDEQREQMKARREKFMAERKAQMAKAQEKMLETIKKYVPDEAKAKALLDELQKTMMGMRRSPMQFRPAGKPATVPAAK